MAYSPKGKVKKTQIEGSTKLVDIWQEEGVTKTYVLTKKEMASLGYFDNLLKKKHNPKKDHPDPLPLNRDGKVLEIYGTVRHLAIENGNLFITVVNKDNHTQTAFLNSKTILRNMCKLSGIEKVNYQALINNNEYREEIVQDFKDSNTRILYRIDTESKDIPYVYAVVSKKWSKVKIADLTPVLEKAKEQFSASYLTIEDSDGLHGGEAILRLQSGHQELTDVEILVTAGYLNGNSAIRVMGRVKVLACANQLSMQVCASIKPIVGNRFYGRKIHAGELIGVLDQITSAISDLIVVYESFNQAKDIQLTPAFTKMILEFYQEKKMISEKTFIHLVELYKNDEITQIPGTLYGLAMAVSWLGTHGNIKQGVRRSLNNLSGELIVVSPHWQEYTELIKAVV